MFSRDIERCFKFQRFVVEIILIYDRLLFTDYVHWLMRSQWQEMNERRPLNARVFLGARTTHVCIIRSREVYYFSLAADLYVLRHIFAYPPFSPLLWHRDHDRYLLSVLWIEDDTISRYFVMLIISFIIFYKFCSRLKKFKTRNCENNHIHPLDLSGSGIFRFFNVRDAYQYMYVFSVQYCQSIERVSEIRRAKCIM